MVCSWRLRLSFGGDANRGVPVINRHFPDVLHRRLWLASLPPSILAWRQAHLPLDTAAQICVFRSLVNVVDFSQNILSVGIHEVSQGLTYVECKIQGL